MSRAHDDYVVLCDFHDCLQFCTGPLNGILRSGAHYLKVLVIGSGGREHALCWKLAQNPAVHLYAAPGNPGIATLATTIFTTDYLSAAEKFRPDLTIIGPEAPLVAGVADQLRRRGFAVVGPSAQAAQLESSKAFAKALMASSGIPTARYVTADSALRAREALRGFAFPVVLKADGLAAGKGVVIAHTPEESEAAIHSLLNLSRGLVIEEFLEGPEVSFIALTDGGHIVPFEPTQDHKAIFDNDEGPNTGGMGAYSDSRILNSIERSQIMDTIIEPAIKAMSAMGHPFSGFLFAGLMMTAEGPKVLEFNARLGDPETQALMMRLDGDFLPALQAAARGQLQGVDLKWNPAPSVCVVLAAHGYPGNVRVGDPITGIEKVENALVFQAGTKQVSNVLQTAGGRVLGITASGATLPASINTVYEEVLRIHFDGMQYRTDIGKKGLKRW